MLPHIPLTCRGEKKENPVSKFGPPLRLFKHLTPMTVQNKENLSAAKLRPLGKLSSAWVWLFLARMKAVDGVCVCVCV